MEIRRADANDQPAILALIAASGLSVGGVLAHAHDFFVAEQDEAVVGCVGLEVYAGAAVLRSLAIAESVRGAGVAAALCHALLDSARRRGITDVYLRTDSAAPFFSRLGFRRDCRTRLPARVLVSSELRGGRAAVTMHLSLVPVRGVDAPFLCPRERAPEISCPCPEGQRALRAH